MDSISSKLISVAEEAAYWLRVREEENSSEMDAACNKWIRASPIHAREFEYALQVDQRLQRHYSRERVDVNALIGRAQREQYSAKRRRWAIRIAAGFMIAAILVAATTGDVPRGTTYTANDDQELINLADGSVVALAPDSRLQVHLSLGARNVYLERGRGLFRVRHDKRPFRVHVGNMVVQAVGTQFDVHVQNGRATVAVVEGTVSLLREQAKDQPNASVLAEPEPLMIVAGQAVTVARAEQPEQVQQVDVSAITAWRKPHEQLEFKNRPLSEIVREFNRHNAAPKLVLADDELAQRRFVLVFKNADPASLLTYLSQDDSMKITHRGDDVVIRRREF